MRGDHILVVCSGADGGIGRFERLLVSALSTLSKMDEGQFSLSAVYGRHPPDYLLSSAMPVDMDIPAVRPARASRAAFASAIGRQLRVHRPALTLFTHVNQLSAIPMLAPLGACPFGVCAYGLEVWEPRTWLIRTNLSFSRRVLAISRFTKERMALAQSIPLDRITVVPLALEDGWIHGSGHHGGESDSRAPTQFLTVSRLDARERRYKRVDEAIRAVARARTAGLAVHHHIVGEGDDLPRLRTVAADCGAADAVTFYGEIPDAQLRQLYASSDAFVLPSRVEGFGLVFLEAMAAGLPVLAVRAGATPEVVTHGKTGLLVSSENELADAVKAVATGAVDVGAMGTAARQEVASRFSFPEFVGRVGHFVAEMHG